MSRNIKSFLADSWGIVKQEPKDSSSDIDQGLAESENESSSTSIGGRIARRRKLEAQRQYNHNTRRLRSSRYSTPLRYASAGHVTPEFVMPTPNTTPVASRRRSTWKSSDRQQMRTPRPNSSKEKVRNTKSDGAQTNNSAKSLIMGKPLLSLLISFASKIVEFLGLIWWLLQIPTAILLAVVIVYTCFSTMIKSFLSPVPLLSQLAAIPHFPPPCSVPIVKGFFPACSSQTKLKHSSAKPLKKFTALHNSFEKVLHISQLNVPLPMHMTHGEVMILELRDVIRYQSKLPSKPELIAEIESYVMHSKDVSWQLMDFSSHINRAVDRVIMTNSYALRELESMRVHSLRGGIFLSILPYWPFYKSITVADIVDQYLNHASIVEEEADALLIESNAIALHLQNMQDSLELMRHTASRDLAGFDDKREELLARFWTKLGGNAKDQKHIQKNIEIAKRIGQASYDARMFMIQVQSELRTVKNDVEDLRARMAGPRNRASMNTQDVEEHIKYVTDAYSRLDSRRREVKQHQNHAVRGILGELNGRVWNRPHTERLYPATSSKELPGTE